MSGDRYLMAREVEMAAWAALLRGAPAGLRRDLGIDVVSTPGAHLLSAAAVEHPLLNRAFLLSEEPHIVDAVVAHYRHIGVDRFMVHRRRAPVATSAAPRHPALAAYRRNWVKIAGPARRWSVEGARDLVIEPVCATDVVCSSELFCRGFDLPVSAAGVFANAASLPGWHVVTARFPGEPVAGIGLLYVHGGIGYLAGGVTDPAYRRRGVQQALLRTRVSIAADHGCEWVVSETGEDAPGDPQHSLRNMQRLGLEVVGVTENLTPSGMIWDHGVRASQAPVGANG